jgi:hypothetical protein
MPEHFRWLCLRGNKQQRVLGKVKVLEIDVTASAVDDPTVCLEDRPVPKRVVLRTAYEYLVTYERQTLDFMMNPTTALQSDSLAALAAARSLDVRPVWLTEKEGPCAGEVVPAFHDCVWRLVYPPTG